jgi:alpha-tubulin suppressor-like RCC1 family protein
LKTFKIKKILIIIKKFNSYGQIGDGTLGTNRLLPVAVNNLGSLSGKSIIQITAGSFHTCVIANDSNSYCWGRNEYLLFFKNNNKK